MATRGLSLPSDTFICHISAVGRACISFDRVIISHAFFGPRIGETRASSVLNPRPAAGRRASVHIIPTGTADFAPADFYACAGFR